MTGIVDQLLQLPSKIISQKAFYKSLAMQVASARLPWNIYGYSVVDLGMNVTIQSMITISIV